jgi:hypothetical protein
MRKRCHIVRSSFRVQGQNADFLPTETVTGMAPTVSTEPGPSAFSGAGASPSTVPFLSFLQVQPEQFGADPRSALQRTGEYRLLVAVLQDALTTWFRYRHSHRLRERRLFQEISEWFSDKRSNWPFAFECICGYLGLDPDYIRRGLVQWQPSSPRQRFPQFQMAPVIRNRERVVYKES